jgi:hypothetical protein
MHVGALLAGVCSCRVGHQFRFEWWVRHRDAIVRLQDLLKSCSDGAHGAVDFTVAESQLLQAGVLSYRYGSR